MHVWIFVFPHSFISIFYLYVCSYFCVKNWDTFVSGGVGFSNDGRGEEA